MLVVAGSITDVTSPMVVIVLCSWHKPIVCSACGYCHGSHRFLSATQASCVQCPWLLTMPTVIHSDSVDCKNQWRRWRSTPVLWNNCVFFCSMNSVVVCSSGSCLQHQQMSRTSTVIRNVTVSQQGLWVVQCCDRLRVTKNVCIIILCSGHRQWTMCSFFLPLPLSLFFLFLPIA